MTKQFLAIYGIYNHLSKDYASLDYKLVDAPEESTLTQVERALESTGGVEQLVNVIVLSKLSQITLGETVGLVVVESDD